MSAAYFFSFFDCYLRIIVGAASDDGEEDENESKSGDDKRPGGNTL